jgi:hypothetical protein
MAFEIYLGSPLASTDLGCGFIYSQRLVIQRPTNDNHASCCCKCLLILTSSEFVKFKTRAIHAPELSPHATAATSKKILALKVLVYFCSAMLY